MTDPIANILNRLKSAQAAKKEKIEVPFSQLTYAIAKILEKNGFVKQVDFKGRHTRKFIEIALRYDEKEPRIAGTKRVSKPGQRIYTAAKEIRRVKNGRGITIVSTSKGLLTDREAKKENVGGEVMCEIW